MAKFVLAYRGGGGMGDTPEAQAAHMEQWMQWFGGLGAAVLDGGNPFASGQTVEADGTVVDGGAAGLTGYSIIDAADAADAAAKARGCPVLASGGTVEVYAAIEM